MLWPMSNEPQTTIGQRLAALDADRFVGRAAALEHLVGLLEADAHRVVLVHGPGGIGKSTLLRELGRRSERRGWEVVWVEARDLPPETGALEALVAPARPAPRVLLVLDSWEQAEVLTRHLRDVLLPSLPEGWRIVVSSRLAPGAEWGQDGWEHLATELPVGPLDDEEARACARAHGAPEPDVDSLAHWAMGSPLAIVLGAASAGSLTGGRPVPPEVAEPLVRRVLGREPSRLGLLGCAAIASRTDWATLAAALPDEDPDEGLAWLGQQAYSEVVTGGLALHAALAESLQTVLARSHPALDSAIRRRLAEHAHAVALAGGRPVSLDLAAMVRDRTLRWGVGWDPHGRVHVDRARAGDAEAIEARLDAAARQTWWPGARRCFAEAPEHTWVARRPDGGVAGFMVVASTADRTAPVTGDAVLGPWLDHALARAADGAAVIWRNATVVDGDPGIQALLGGGGLLVSGVPNPRFLYLPIDPVHPLAVAFSRSLGGRHEPSLDVDHGEGTTECHIVDLGPGGILGAQLAIVLAELGPAPAADAPAASGEVREADVRNALRDWDTPPKLAQSALASGTGTGARAEAARAAIRRAIGEAFGESEQEALLRRVLEVRYLEHADTHEQAATRLHLSRSAYFRHLKVATDRLVVELVTPRAP